MIVVREAGEWWAFRQEAHAHLAGELAARVPVVRWERSAFVAAARLHDNGWREADSAPTLDSDGVPHRFYAVSPEVYLGVWRRGIARAAAVDGLVGLLVGLHGARFFATNPHPQVRALHDEERAREDRVLGELGLGGSWRDLPAGVRAASDWIAFLDRLSLLLCGELADDLTTEVDGVAHRTLRTGDDVTVDPWPFDDQGGPVAIAGLRLADATALTRTRTLRPA